MDAIGPRNLMQPAQRTGRQLRNVDPQLNDARVAQALAFCRMHESHFTWQMILDEMVDRFADEAVYLQGWLAGSVNHRGEVVRASLPEDRDMRSQAGALAR